MNNTYSARLYNRIEMSKSLKTDCDCDMVEMTLLQKCYPARFPSVIKELLCVES